jgi:cysteine-rich repeat protein
MSMVSRALASSLLIACGQGKGVGADGLDTDPFPHTSTGSEGPNSEASDDSDATSLASTNATTSDAATSESTGSGTDGETSSPLCGNAEMDPGEDCDDGNAVQADGCNNDCSISGSVIWEHVHASGLGADGLRGVAVDDMNDAYVVGLERLADATQIGWVRKYSRQGGLEWTRTIAGAAAGNHVLLGIAGGTGEIVVVGTIDNAGSTGEDIVYAAYDADGNPAWQMGYSSAITDGDGAPVPGADGGFGAAFDPAGNPVVVGQVQTQSASRNIWTRMLTPAGVETWTQTYDSAASGNDQGRDVAVDAAGNVVVAGFEEGPTSRDIFVRKYDPAGVELWTHTHDNAEALEDRAEGVAVDGDDNVIVVGWETSSTSGGRWWVRKLAPDGAELWTEVDEGDTSEGMRANAVATTDSGDIAVVGSVVAAGFGAAVVRKYDADGDERWTRTFESQPSTGAEAFDVAVRGDEGLYVVGQLDRGVDAADAWIVRTAP